MKCYSLNNEEDILRDGVEAAAKKILTTEALNKHDGFPKEIFDAFAELGLTALSIPEEYGGLAASPRLQAAIYDTISSYNLGPAVFLSVHGMVSGLISRFGSEEIKQKFLPDLASGKHLAAFGLSEPHAGSDAAALSTTAEGIGDNYIVSGEKCWISSAGAASIYLVFARVPGSSGKDGVNALIVPGDSEGLTVGPLEEKMGCELSPIGSLYFDKCKIPTDLLIGESGQGYSVALGGLTGGRVNIAACACGLSRAAFAQSTQYLTERKQFGKALKDFQGLQFKIADMKIQLDAAELLVGRAAASLEQNPASPETRLHAAIAKCSATDSAMQITTESVQLHGAVGYVKSTGVEQLMRDAKMLQIVEGANEIQRSIIAREVFKADS